MVGQLAKLINLLLQVWQIGQGGMGLPEFVAYTSTKWRASVTGGGSISAGLLSITDNTKSGKDQGGDLATGSYSYNTNMNTSNTSTNEQSAGYYPVILTILQKYSTIISRRRNSWRRLSYMLSSISRGRKEKCKY